MGKIISIYGLPGTGKGTQAELLAKKYGLYHFGMGNKLRAEIEADTELGKKIKIIVENGLLVPDEAIRAVLQNITKQAQETGVIFDGFPRMLPQAKILDEILAEANLELDFFILLKISAAEAKKRINKRLEKENRGDDQDDTVINNRIAVFHQESVPLIAYYRAKGKLIEIDGEKNIAEVFAEIDKYLKA